MLRVVRKKRVANFIVCQEHGAGGCGTASGCITGALSCSPKRGERVGAVFVGNAVCGFHVVFYLL